MNIGQFYINKKQIIIFVTIVAGLIATILLVQNRQIFKSRASLTNRPFDVIQDTNPQKPAECSGKTCTVNTLDVIIKPNLENEPKDAIPARVTLPKSNVEIDPSVGYYIPFRDTSVSVADPEAVKRRILNSWPNARLENWDTIVNQSIASGWNPAFMIALWMEESGAQGRPDYADAFGCEPTNPTTDINKSLGCVFNSFEAFGADRFGDFMCIYGGDGFHNSPCTFNNENPRFPGDLSNIYSELVPSGPGALVR